MMSKETKPEEKKEAKQKPRFKALRQIEKNFLEGYKEILGDIGTQIDFRINSLK